MYRGNTIDGYYEKITGGNQYFLNAIIYALVGRFKLELLIFISYFFTVVPPTTAQARRQKKLQNLLKMSL